MAKKKSPRARCFAVALAALSATSLGDRAWAAPAPNCDLGALTSERAKIVVREPASEMLAEGILWHPSGRWFLLSGRQGLVRYAAGGKRLGSWGDLGPGLNVAGLAVDPKGDSVWALATAAGQSRVLQLSFETGARLADYPLPGVDQWYGDLAVAPDGSVFVGVGRYEGVLRLRKGANAFERLALSEQVRGPQGMFVTPDGGALVVASYGSGLQVIDLKRGLVRLVDASAVGNLRGVDGLLLAAGDVIAVRNGGKPFAVVRLSLDAEMSRVRTAALIAPELFRSLTACNIEPTLLDRRGSDIYVVARSLVDGAPGPGDQSMVIRLPLRPPPQR